MLRWAIIRVAKERPHWNHVRPLFRRIWQFVRMAGASWMLHPTCMVS